MKHFFYLISVLILGVLQIKPIPKEPENPNNAPFVVIQLFTSQGCSSCPPADRLLEKVKKNYSTKNVIALSYHVDYWNRLGWQDPFSKKEYSALQAAYENKFHYGSVYTPQVILNGKTQFVGSNQDKMENYLQEFLSKKGSASITFGEIKKKNNSFFIPYTITGIENNESFKVALFIEHRDTPVSKGENGGRVLSNSNIVANEITINSVITNGVAEVKIPAIVTPNDKLGVAGFLQKDDLSIVGATMKQIKGF